MTIYSNEDKSRVSADLVLQKVAWRLVPLLVAAYCASYLDRVNIGFAATEMNRDLGLSPAAYGWGAGIFFIGYALFETPSNYIMHFVGARRWIARIMVSWGLASALMAFAWDEKSFVTFRFLLGVSEAGFMPGIILYLTYWIPRERRAKILAAFLFAVPLATVIGAPLSSAILSLSDGLGGHKGWQWLFMVQAVPPILLGVITFFHLTDRPEDATWLRPEERQWLTSALAQEQGDSHQQDERFDWSTLVDPVTLTLGVAYSGLVLSLYGLTLWLPQIVNGFGLGGVAGGFVTAIPFVFASVGMLYWSRRSDRAGERVFHTVGAAALAAAGLLAVAVVKSHIASIGVLSVVATATLAAMPTFWAFATTTLTGARAAVAIALINSIGNLAGFGGPYLVGWVKQTTGSFSLALAALSLGPLLCALIITALGRRALNPPKLSYSN